MHFCLIFYSGSCYKQTPLNVKKVSVTGAGCLPGCKNTEFVWELRKTGFCEGGHKLSCPLMRVPVRRASAVLILPFLLFLQTVLSSHQCVFCKELGLCFASSSTELLLTRSVCWWFQGIKTFVFVALIEVTFVDNANTAVCQ